MPERVGVFSVPDAKRIAEATRLVMGGARSVLGAPHRPSRGQVPIIQDNDLPNGAGCSATNCAEGSDVGSAICCKTHHSWTAVIPSFGTVVFNYVSGEVWESAVRTKSCYGTDGTYKFRRTLSGSGANIVSTIEIVGVAWGDCDPYCLVYKTCCKITCQCSQRHALVSFGGLSSGELAGEICLSPRGYAPICGFAADDDPPASYTMVISGYSDDTGDADFEPFCVDPAGSGPGCSLLNGTWVLNYSHTVVTVYGGNAWVYRGYRDSGGVSFFAEMYIGNIFACGGERSCGATLGIQCDPLEIGEVGGHAFCTITGPTSPTATFQITNLTAENVGCDFAVGKTHDVVPTAGTGATEDGACDSPCEGYGGGSDTCAGSKTYTAIESGGGYGWLYVSGSCSGTCGAGTCDAPPVGDPTFAGQEVTVPCTCA